MVLSGKHCFAHTLNIINKARTLFGDAGDNFLNDINKDRKRSKLRYYIYRVNPNYLNLLTMDFPQGEITNAIAHSGKGKAFGANRIPSGMFKIKNKTPNPYLQKMHKRYPAHGFLEIWIKGINTVIFKNGIATMRIIIDL